MPAPSTGLARVTISAPQRRVDVALPDGVPLAELLPELLRHAGDGLADDGERHGGWLLRRPDGTPLSLASGLASQGVRDGAVLQLVPARAQWPELEYDDVVEAIAAGARRYGLGWSPLATRLTALAVAGAALAAALIAVLRAGPPWSGPAVAALAVAAVLVLAGALASRAYGDAVVGATLAGYGLPFAFTGGLVLLAEQRPLGALGHGEFPLVGCAVLMLASVVGAVGVVHGLRLFVAGITAGLLGGIAAALSLGLTAAGGVAAVLALLVTGVAAAPLLAIRLGKLPMPVLALPTDVAGTGQGLPPPPDRARVFASVARTDEMLTGMVTGVALVATVAMLVLVRASGVAEQLLVAVGAVAFVLRARLFVTVRQRLPLLGVGVAGLGLLAVGTAGGASLTSAGLVALAGLVVALAGARYASAPPSPYFGRAADVLDALCIVAVVPIACGVLGLYALARGIAG